MKKTTLLFLWLGAAISISEIFTGGLLAPLGFLNGIIIIVTGHIIGTAFLAFASLISFNQKSNAMESAAFSLGSTGGKAAAACNVLQLVGWTVVMTAQAAMALLPLLPEIPVAAAAVVMAALVLIWALVFGNPAASLFHSIIVVLLALMCLALFGEAVFGSFASGFKAGAANNGGISMLLALELSIAMPVSWLPLAGDYAVRSKSRKAAFAMPFAGYFTGSVLMYGAGLFISIKTGGDIFNFLAASRFRVLACVVVLLSTLTTAFLDLYSAAVSMRQFFPKKTSHNTTKVNMRVPLALLGAIVIAACAFFPMDKYGDFLTLFLTFIGMIFIPVYALIFLDNIFKKPREEKTFPVRKFIVIAAGMAVYQICTHFEFGIPTIISMIVVGIGYLITIVNC